MGAGRRVAGVLKKLTGELPNGSERHSMSGRALLKEEETEEEKDSVVSLKLITGGKDGGGRSSGTWLDNIEVGEVFYAQSTNPQVSQLIVWRLVELDGKVHVLVSPEFMEMDGEMVRPKRQAHDPVRFCRQWNLYQRIGVFAIKEKEDDGDRVQVDTGGEAHTLEGLVGLQGEPPKVPA